MTAPLSPSGPPESGDHSHLPCMSLLSRDKDVIPAHQHTDSKISPTKLRPLVTAGYTLCLWHPFQAEPLCFSGGTRNKIVLNLKGKSYLVSGFCPCSQNHKTLKAQGVGPANLTHCFSVEETETLRVSDSTKLTPEVGIRPRIRLLIPIPRLSFFCLDLAMLPTHLFHR